MQLEVDRNDLHRTRLVGEDGTPLAAECARLRIDRFALTSNNVTYAAFGDALQYWNFFPSSGSWGRVPIWGFADVVESRCAELAVGGRVYGFLPMATTLTVQPGRLDDRGFRDVAEHRQPMAGTYNRYSFTDGDPVYRPERESHHMVLWPLFFTSFLIDDFFDDNGMFGAQTVVVSSASSKTSIGAAFLLSERPGVHVIGLTSARHAGFVRELGCYHQTIPYDDVTALPQDAALFVDVAGNLDVRNAVHERYGDRLCHSMIVGRTHWDHEASKPNVASGPEPQFFFAPAQIAKRTSDWGQATLDERVASAWHRYVDWVDRWIAFEPCEGAAAVDAAYHTLLEGESDPRVGYVCSMAT